MPSSTMVDMEAFIAELAPTLGLSRGRTLTYIDVGMQLELMSRLARLLHHRAHLPLAHLAVLARATVALSKPESLAALEDRLPSFILPREDGEALRGVRSFHKFLQKEIEEIEPQLRPRDLPGDKDPQLMEADLEKVGESISFEGDGPLAEVLMDLEKSRALEFKATLDAIATSAECSRVEALTHLVRGTSEASQAKIVLNLYCPATQERPRTAWLGGAGWLSEVVTPSWIARVTHVRMLADDSTDSYVPTDSQRAYVQGRDGTCRFPGCDAPAEACDIDHIEPFDHENPEDGGKTETENLHCLCRRHHNMKTAGLWSVAREKGGKETWESSSTGKKLVSMEQGPLAGHGRYSFDLRGQKIAQTLAEHNARRKDILERSRRVVESTRETEHETQHETPREEFGF
nr:HNH endonuclease signature motif containing protein [Corynebacterium lactis]